MDTVLLKSYAEKAAEKAEELPCFSGFKLLHFKRQIAQVLGLIGRNGVFHEYTKHDISHINFMLDSLDNIIPKSTKENLTSSNWLMITLSIYLHDLGMLVTRDEYDNRNNSPFSQFRDRVLSGHFGVDYRDKIAALESNAQDVFLYQEYVRKTHAERIKKWVQGEVAVGGDTAIVEGLNDLMRCLDSMFRRDLAFICESHHLSDLGDFDKYKLDQQYGPANDARVNLHYCALVLRTADLLHITSDRTPSIEYALINPRDPISQDEWAKQKAVKAIRPKPRLNKEGQINNDEEPDTFEIIAYFEEDKGFFGLVSYINYASEQLRENYNFNEQARRLIGETYQYHYPWKYIDDRGIETKDFDKRQFEFVLDQNKILNLLIGHTLYNDSTVVLRELTQNAIDATRLMTWDISNTEKSTYHPRVDIICDKKGRTLEFLDNGTGMNLEIIQNHLLKVGSSRYQDAEFKKKYPDFYPISRFGIGLLTCFLIADDVDITTKTRETDKAILLKIRKVHGKYLLKYLSPENTPPLMRQHGTSIKLYVRSDISLENVENDLRHWILFPGIEVWLKLDSAEVNIGFKSPKEALEKFMTDQGYSVDGTLYKVKQFEENGITVAFALKYFPHWDEWAFLSNNRGLENNNPTGLCVEGIRVSTETPGFTSNDFFVLANTYGKNAPKTNVARSTIEITNERKQMLGKVYSLYFKHLSEEIERIIQNGFSVTWAAKEAIFLLSTFLGLPSSHRLRRERNPPEDPQIFEEALCNFNCVLMERNRQRELVSIGTLKVIGHFWTIECGAYSSADSLVREVKGKNTSVIDVLRVIYGDNESNVEHVDVLMCNTFLHKSELDKIIVEGFQVEEFRVFKEQRRLDLKWGVISIKENWYRIPIFDTEQLSTTRESYIYLLREDATIKSNLEEKLIFTYNALYILSGTTLYDFLVRTHSELNNGEDDDDVIQVLFGIIFEVYKAGWGQDTFSELIDRIVESNLRRETYNSLWTRIDKQELISVVERSRLPTFDNTIWARRNAHDYLI